MKYLIKRNINGKKILVLFTLTNIIYATMLTITIPKVMSFSEGMKLLDMMPAGYTPTYVNALLRVLGTEGRKAYLYKQIPLDMVYPMFFGITYSLLLAYIMRKLGNFINISLYLCLIPIFSGLFDYFENLGIITILYSYPANLSIVSQTTSVFSVLKTFFATIYFIILAIYLIVYIMKLIISKRENRENEHTDYDLKKTRHR